MISLDFELIWGVRDKRTIDEYGENILGVRSVVPRLLELFNKHEIHSTWAIVGFLFFKTYDELIRGLPTNKPLYLDDRLSPYVHINNIGNNEQEDPYHYAHSLVKLIASIPYQEIGSHTFSHYYCLERGQDDTAFESDLKAAIRIAEKYGITLRSLVFPRNQYNESYIQICEKLGIESFRGNEDSWIYTPKEERRKSIFQRGVRLIDSYLNLSGHHAYDTSKMKNRHPYNIPSSRFLRPYSKKYKIVEPLKARRIKADLTYAAKNSLIYHLWWHPHNFGINTDENFAFLEKILSHYLYLKDRYGMESLNMGELASKVERE